MSTWEADEVDTPPGREGTPLGLEDHSSEGGETSSEGQTQEKGPSRRMNLLAHWNGGGVDIDTEPKSPRSPRTSSNDAGHFLEGFKEKETDKTTNEVISSVADAILNLKNDTERSTAHALESELIKKFKDKRIKIPVPTVRNALIKAHEYLTTTVN